VRGILQEEHETANEKLSQSTRSGLDDTLTGRRRIADFVRGIHLSHLAVHVRRPILGKFDQIRRQGQEIVKRIREHGVVGDGRSDKLP
jgi:hypothetical protein